MHIMTLNLLDQVIPPVLCYHTYSISTAEFALVPGRWGKVRLVVCFVGWKSGKLEDKN